MPAAANARRSCGSYFHAAHWDAGRASGQRPEVAEWNPARTPNGPVWVFRVLPLGRPLLVCRLSCSGCDSERQRTFSFSWARRRAPAALAERERTGSGSGTGGGNGSGSGTGGGTGSGNGSGNGRGVRVG